MPGDPARDRLKPALPRISGQRLFNPYRFAVLCQLRKIQTTRSSADDRYQIVSL